MGNGTMAGWAAGVCRGAGGLAALPGLDGGDVWWPAVVAGACSGWLLGRWAQHYADRLADGAPATARTLWMSAAAAPWCPGRPARDAAMAATLGLASGLLAAGGSPGLVLLALTLASLAWIDVRSGLLPDALTLPLMMAGWLLGVQSPGAAAGASALTWASLAGLAWLYRCVRGRDGFGGGDVKCLAALAGWLGPETAAAILWLACMLGLMACLGRRGGWRRPYPFGPCIALAAGMWMLGCA